MSSPKRFLQTLAQRTSLLFFLIAAVALGCLPQAFASEPETCATNPANHRLDYWLGDWSIGGSGAAPSATSHVYRALGQCVVIESWDGGRGDIGENIFGYSVGDHSWHGFFADSRGHVHVFVDGKVAGGTAEFTGPSLGPNGETVLNRIRILRLSANKVEQRWDKSTDNGATWTNEFRLQYTRKTAN